MNCEEFWNKAIEHYCIAGKPEGSNIFMPISEEKLEEIYQIFIDNMGYDDGRQMNIRLLKYGNGSIKNSYFSAVQYVHSNQHLPQLFPFLRFCLFGRMNIPMHYRVYKN